MICSIYIILPTIQFGVLYFQTNPIIGSQISGERYPFQSAEPPVDQCLKLWLDVLKQKMWPSIHAIPMQNDVRVCAHIVYIYKNYTLHCITLRYVTLRYITHVHTQIQSQNKYTHLFMLHYTYTYMHTIGVAQSIVLEHHPSIVSSEIRSMQNPCRRHHHHHQQHHGST